MFAIVYKLFHNLYIRTRDAVPYEFSTDVFVIITHGYGYK